MAILYPLFYFIYFVDEFVDHHRIEYRFFERAEDDLRKTSTFFTISLRAKGRKEIEVIHRQILDLLLICGYEVGEETRARLWLSFGKLLFRFFRPLLGFCGYEVRPAPKLHCCLLVPEKERLPFSLLLTSAPMATGWQIVVSRKEGENRPASLVTIQVSYQDKMVEIYEQLSSLLKRLGFSLQGKRINNASGGWLEKFTRK